MSFSQPLNKTRLWFPYCESLTNRKEGKMRLSLGAKKWLLFYRQVFFLLLCAPIWGRRWDLNPRRSPYEGELVTYSSLLRYISGSFRSLTTHLHMTLIGSYFRTSFTFVVVLIYIPLTQMTKPHIF